MDDITVHVVCDDTDVFVLYYYRILFMTNDVYMMSMKASTTVIDIKATVLKHQGIIISLPAAQSLSGCDSVATFYGIGKKGTEISSVR